MVAPPPVRRNVTLEERAALRAARKARASEAMAKESGGTGGATGGQAKISAGNMKWLYYSVVVVPAGLFGWAYNDDSSPPAQFFRMIGLTGFITSYTDEISKPSHEKLLPDWNQVSYSRLQFNDFLVWFGTLCVCEGMTVCQNQEILN